MKNHSWTTSLDGEIFNGNEFATREEAIKYMVADLPAEDLKEGFWVGQVESVSVANFLDCETLIEDIQCQAESECGEVAEDYLNDITNEQKLELNSLLIDWFKKHDLEPTFFRIKNAEKITL